MNWIQLIDKHPDGFGFLALVAIVGVTVSIVTISLAIAEFAGKRK